MISVEVNKPLMQLERPVYSIFYAVKSTNKSGTILQHFVEFSGLKC